MNKREYSQLIKGLDALQKHCIRIMECDDCPDKVYEICNLIMNTEPHNYGIGEPNDNSIEFEEV